MCFEFAELDRVRALAAQEVTSPSLQNQFCRKVDTLNVGGACCARRSWGEWRDSDANSQGDDLAMLAGCDAGCLGNQGRYASCRVASVDGERAGNVGMNKKSG